MKCGSGGAVNGGAAVRRFIFWMMQDVSGACRLSNNKRRGRVLLRTAAGGVLPRVKNRLKNWKEPAMVID